MRAERVILYMHHPSPAPGVARVSKSDAAYVDALSPLKQSTTVIDCEPLIKATVDLHCLPAATGLPSWWAAAHSLSPRSG